MKRIALLGSTGSIGKNVLKVIEHFPSKFELVSISCLSNIAEFVRQVKYYKPQKACIVDESKSWDLKKELGKFKNLYFGKEGLDFLTRDKDVDLVVVAITGNNALSSVLAAIDAKKKIALANKESLVMAGSIIIKNARKNGVQIMPIDSEASAIWQCLEGNDPSDINSIYLTASGGPLENIPRGRFSSLAKENILSHPRWKMGKKITVDSATLMNKGFEVIETHWLFGIDARKIKVLVHPEAIIHSLVEFKDGSCLSQLAITDMKLPIQYALTYPERLANDLPLLDFYRIKNLTFKKPDFCKFPCLGLAYEALENGGSATCVLSCADEEAVSSFLRDELEFINIPKVVEKVLSRHRTIKDPSIGDLFEVEEWARSKARELINKKRR